MDKLRSDRQEQDIKTYKLKARLEELRRCKQELEYNKEKLDVALIDRIEAKQMAIEQHRELDEIEAGIDSDDLRKSQRTDNTRKRSMAIVIHEPNDCGGDDDDVWS